MRVPAWLPVPGMRERCLPILPVSAFGADKVALQLIWKNQFQFAGYYVARELGFYNDASGALFNYYNEEY